MAGSWTLRGRFTVCQERPEEVRDGLIQRGRRLNMNTTMGRTRAAQQLNQVLQSDNQPGQPQDVSHPDYTGTWGGGTPRIKCQGLERCLSCLRSQTALVEVLSSIPSTNMVALNCL